MIRYFAIRSVWSNRLIKSGLTYLPYLFLIWTHFKKILLAVLIWCHLNKRVHYLSFHGPKWARINNLFLFQKWSFQIVLMERFFLFCGVSSCLILIQLGNFFESPTLIAFFCIVAQHWLCIVSLSDHQKYEVDAVLWNDQCGIRTNIVIWFCPHKSF